MNRRELVFRPRTDSDLTGPKPADGRTAPELVARESVIEAPFQP